MGSSGGGKAPAIAYTLIETAKMNGVDPQAWLAGDLSPFRISPPIAGDIMDWAYQDVIDAQGVDCEAQVAV